MITNSEEYVAGLEREISYIKSKGKRYLYRPAEELHPSVAKDIEIYFMAREWYNLEMKKCQSCLNQYEIIIEIGA